MENKENVALVIGDLGITGASLVEHLNKDDRFKKIYGVSRRAAKDYGKYTHLSVDIYDKEQCKQKLAKHSSLIGELTHIFYTAWVKKETEQEQEEYNFQMFKNVMETLEPICKKLKQIVLQNGTKYYGCHMHGFKVPAVESQERHEGPNFYFKDLDWLKENCKGKQWKWIETRPSTIIGFSKIALMNLGTSIAIYAAIQKELGESFLFPHEESWNTTVDVTDVDLLSEFTLWAIFDEKARDNQSFNIVNGDTFHWKDMWVKIGEYFGFKREAIGLKKRDIEEEMKNKEETWKSMIKKYNLKENDLMETGTWWFVKAELGRSWDVYSSMETAKSFGWKKTINSEECFKKLFKKLQENAIIPKFE